MQLSRIIVLNFYRLHELNCSITICLQFACFAIFRIPKSLPTSVPRLNGCNELSTGILLIIGNRTQTDRIRLIMTNYAREHQTYCLIAIVPLYYPIGLTPLPQVNCRGHKAVLSATTNAWILHSELYLAFTSPVSVLVSILQSDNHQVYFSNRLHCQLRQTVCKIISSLMQTLMIYIAQIAPLSFQGRHRTQTQTSEVRWAARFSGHWVVTSMFA